MAADAPVRVIDAFVDGLDVNGLGFGRSVPAATGRPPYDPRDLLKLYIWGYFNEVRSSRCLERECRRNVEAMWLLRRLCPDFKAIADFRRDNGTAADSSYRRNTLKKGGCDEDPTTAFGRRSAIAVTKSATGGPDEMSGDGFWAAMAAGSTSEDAALEAGVPSGVGIGRLRRSSGDFHRNVRTVGQATFGMLSHIRRAGGDRLVARAGLRNAGGCSSA